MADPLGSSEPIGASPSPYSSSPPQFNAPTPTEMEVELSSPTTPTPTTFRTSTEPAGFEFSSDPLNGTPFSTANLPASLHRLDTRQTRKRAPPTPAVQPNKNPRTTQEPQKTARAAILEARDLIIQASILASTHEEQSRILDLLEIFREYTEKGRVQAASRIIASQVAHLETATRQIETKAKALAKAPIPTQIPAPLQKPTFATNSYYRTKSSFHLYCPGMDYSRRQKDQRPKAKAKAKAKAKYLKPPYPYLGYT